MQLLAPRYLFLELIYGAFWVQNGKNYGHTKMSVESWKSYIVMFQQEFLHNKLDIVQWYALVIASNDVFEEIVA